MPVLLCGSVMTGNMPLEICYLYQGAGVQETVV